MICAFEESADIPQFLSSDIPCLANSEWIDR
jgi:hypothetical protein